MVILFLGHYLAADPATYRKGALRLVPMRWRARAAEVVDEMASALRWWLAGKLLSMTLIGIATSLGLLALGSPAPLALGLLAAALTFVPNFGPLIAAIPAMLLDLLSGPMTAVWVGLLYLGIQVVESYVVTPLIQERTVSLPPGLTIAAQVVLGVAAGVFGLALATPLVTAVLVATKRLYVEDFVGDSIRQPAPGR
jgi:predicted PurR-regulated permease PerM